MGRVSLGSGRTVGTVVAVTSTVRAAVVAGLDGSPESAAAVDLAAWEAVRRGAPLRLVHANRPAPPRRAAVFVPGATQPRRERWDPVRTQAARVRRRFGADLPIELVVTQGDPGAILVDESRAAALVVLGWRGADSLYSPLLGSVAARVAAHAHAPAILVRPAPSRPAPSGVVVGVTGSPSAAAAVDFAFEEAAARGGGLTAVYAWAGGAPDLVTAQRDAERLLSEAVAGWADKYPAVDLVCRAVPSLNPLRVLLEEGGCAELIVVGAPRRGGFSNVLLGSVTDGLVHHAHAPVAVVPAEQPGLSAIA